MLVDKNKIVLLKSNLTWIRLIYIFLFIIIGIFLWRQCNSKSIKYLFDDIRKPNVREIELNISEDLVFGPIIQYQLSGERLFAVQKDIDNILNKIEIIQSKTPIRSDPIDQESYLVVRVNESQMEFLPFSGIIIIYESETPMVKFMGKTIPIHNDYRDRIYFDGKLLRGEINELIKKLEIISIKKENIRDSVFYNFYKKPGLKN